MVLSEVSVYYILHSRCSYSTKCMSQPNISNLFIYLALLLASITPLFYQHPWAEVTADVVEDVADVMEDVVEAVVAVTEAVADAVAVMEDAAVAVEA